MSTTRDKLSLSSDAASKKNKIPKLKEVELKVRFDISKDTLLTYQHKHNTNTHFLPLKLKLNPTTWADLNEIERHVLVNCLKKDIRLPYDYPINGHIIHDKFTDDLLFKELNDTAEDILLEELQFASDLINITKNDFVPFIVDNTTRIVTDYLDDPEAQSISPHTLISKHRNKTYLEWSGSTDLVISQIIKELDDESLRFPFPIDEALSTYSLLFIDLDKIPTLACLFGHVAIEEDHSFYQKDRHSLLLVGNEESLSHNLVKVLIEQTSHLLENIRHEPVGFLFEDSVLACIDEFNKIKNDAVDNIRDRQKELKEKKDKTELGYAQVLLEVNDDQHLSLTIQQGYYWKPLYFKLLTQTIKNDLYKYLIANFSDRFKFNNNDMELQPDIADPDRLYFSSTEDDDPRYDFWDRHEWSATSSPSEMALLLMPTVERFFLSNNWLRMINIAPPKIKPWKAIAPKDKNWEEFTEVEDSEIIVISDYFKGSPAPRHSELILEVGMIKSALKEA